MGRDRFEPNSPQEEAMWRAQVLRRTARICSAKAKELERMAKADANAPMRDSGTLKDVLKRIDNVMEWRFVNALGEIGGTAPSLAIALAIDVVGLVSPAHGLLAGLLVNLAGLGQLDVANLQLLKELLHVARMVAGVFHAVAQKALEGLDAELLLALGSRWSHERARSRPRRRCGP